MAEAPAEARGGPQADSSASTVGSEASETTPILTEQTSVGAPPADDRIPVAPESENPARSQASEAPEEQPSASPRTFRFIAPAQSLAGEEFLESQVSSQTQPDGSDNRSAKPTADPAPQLAGESSTASVQAAQPRMNATGDAGPIPEVAWDAQRSAENSSPSEPTGVESASGADPVAEEEEPINPVIPADRFIQGFTIGWSATDVPNRNVGRGLPRSSWATFVRLSIEPKIQRGIRRFELHNPFGTLPNEVMQLDQFLHAKEAGLDFLADGFVEAWKPITDSGIEVIGYVGCGTVDPDFDDLDPNAWQARALASVQPLLDAGMSIGLDAAVTTAADSETYEFAMRLRRLGTRVYVEAKPSRFAPHWFAFDVIAQDRAWLTADIEQGHPQAKNYGIRNDQLLGESVRMVSPRSPDETWDDLKGQAYLDRVNEILSEGQSVIADTTQLFKLRPEVIFQAGLRELPASYD